MAQANSEKRPTIREVKNFNWCKDLVYTPEELKRLWLRSYSKKAI